MTITINNQAAHLSSEIKTLADLASFRSIPFQGTAIALNGKLVKADKWDVTNLSEGDSLLIISAAYGG